MSIEHTIIFTGPVQSGKTSAIASVSDVPVISTKEVTSDLVLDLGFGITNDKSASLVMDYGCMEVGGEDRIHLFATPGDERFDFMWDALTEGAIGVIILLDNSHRAVLKEMEFFLGAFGALVAKRRAIVGINRMEEHPVPTLRAYQERAELLDVQVPIFELDPRRPNDVRTALRALLYSQDPGLVQSPV